MFNFNLEGWGSEHEKQVREFPGGVRVQSLVREDPASHAVSPKEKDEL